MASAPLAIRPRNTGEILDDAWRLYLAEAPVLLLLLGLFLVPAFALLLLLVGLPPPEGPARWLLPPLAATLLPLTGLGSGACQELFRRRVEGQPVTLRGCLGASLRRGLEHGTARCVLLLGVFTGLGCLLFPGLMIWSSCAPVHALIAANKGRPFVNLNELGREARFDPGKAAVVTLSRLPLLLLAFLNVHLVIQMALWGAGNVLGLEVAFLGVQLGLNNGFYDLAVLLLCWWLLAPQHEAANFLLFSDTRTRQEGLDLYHRVQRLFPAVGRRAGVVLALAGSLFLGTAPLRAAEGPTETVRAVRTGLDQIRTEVEQADPYPGGGRWLGPLQALADRLKRSGDGKAQSFVWFDQALEGFGGRDRTGALRTLQDLRQQLDLYEETLTPEADGRPARSKEDVKGLLRPREPGTTRSERPEAEKEKEKVRRDEEEPKEQRPVRRGRGSGGGGAAPAPAAGFGSLVWILLAGLLLAVVLVSSLLYWTNRRASGPKPPRPTSGVAAPTDDGPAPDEQPADVLWRQAAALAQAGQFLEATRSLYAAILSLLHREQLLRYERTRTNGEYVQQVRLAPEAPPGLAAPFARLTALFDLKWYGGQACDGPGYAACHRLAEEIRGMIGG
jgi:hypothetical protein